MAIGNTGVVSGCAVTPVSSMTINVAAGSAIFGGNPVTVASQNLVVATASAADRIDAVGIDSTGTARIVTGYGLASAPQIPGNQGTPLAGIHVVGGATSIVARNIIDWRSFIRAQELVGASFVNGSQEVTGNVLLDGTVNGGYDAISVECTFTETTGAGVYTANVPIPAGSTVLDIKLRSTALWTATTSAIMAVGDTANGAGTWFTNVNLKVTDLILGQEINFTQTNAKEGTNIVTATKVRKAYYPAADSILATVTTVGGSGNAGRTRMLVTYTTPLLQTAATKV